MPAHDRLFYGYRLRAGMALPSLPPLPSGGEPDIELSFGDVPAHFADPAWKSPFIEIDTDGAVIAQGGKYTRFLIRDGRHIVLDRTAQSHPDDTETFLIGMVAGILFHQRGDFSLHASCVRLGNRAIAVAGPSGRGKSTLAAALTARGHALVTDDICRIQFTEDAAHAVPGSSRLRLWPDAAHALSHDPSTLAAGRADHPKRLLIMPDCGPAPVRLAAVVRLGIDTRLEHPRLERLSGPASVTPADEIVYRARLGRRMGRRVGMFQDLMRLGGLVPIFRLTRIGDRADLPALVRLIESLAADSP